MEMDLWTYEREQWNSGLTALCGVDEAGAGPLAGPVYAAAVILPREIGFPGLNDSKKLTAKKRNVLFDQIRHGRGVQHRLCDGGGDRQFGYPQRPDAGYEPGH